MTERVGQLRSIPTWQITLGLALFALGFLIAAQLAAEGPRIRYTTQERTPLVETALGLQRQQDKLKSQIVALRDQIQALEEQGQGTTATVRDLNSRLEQARIAAGLIPLRGTGLVLRLSDSTRSRPADANEADYLVTTRDIRTVVDELWLAGAEAIDVNLERVTTSTGILDIGQTILVNSAYLAPPYTISAIGPPDMFDQLGLSLGWREFVQARGGTFGLDIKFVESKIVDVPQFAGGLNLRESHAVPSGEPTP